MEKDVIIILLFLEFFVQAALQFFLTHHDHLIIVVYFQRLVLQNYVSLAFSSRSPSFTYILAVIMPLNDLNYYNFLKISFVLLLRKNQGFLSGKKAKKKHSDCH